MRMNRLVPKAAPAPREEDPLKSTPTAAPWIPEVEDLQSRRVLLAEDDSELRVLLAEELVEDGFEVLEARNGYELMEAVGRHTDGTAVVDCVITDIRMPGPEGLFALASLREEDWRTPVIVTTGFGDAATHEEAERLGAVAVLDKPFDYEALRELLDSLLVKDA